MTERDRLRLVRIAAEESDLGTVARVLLEIAPTAEDERARKKATQALLDLFDDYKD